MLYRFTVISNEVEDFVLELKIDADASFYDLHSAIMRACNYEEDKLMSFTFCTDDWQKVQDITLEDMTTSSDEDSFLMKSTKLKDFVEEEKQHLIYTFDPMAGRALFMELSEIVFRKSIDSPEIIRINGQPPVQFVDFDDFMEQNAKFLNASSENLDDMLGDEIGDDDIDLEGFEVSDGDPYQ